ncbi:MAG: hypothetical protein Q7T08_08295 [Devosia sp.]|nr:hypothetical protein [Devosia sp.]
MTLNYISMHDRLVANSYKSWGNNGLWEAYRIVWLLGAYLEYLKLSVTRLRAKSLTDYLQAMAPLRLVGGGFGPFFELQEKVDALVEEVDIDVEVESTVPLPRSASAMTPIPGCRPHSGTCSRERTTSPTTSSA